MDADSLSNIARYWKAIENVKDQMPTKVYIVLDNTKDFEEAGCFFEKLTIEDDKISHHSGSYTVKKQVYMIKKIL